MTERYDEETLAALARPSVGPPRSLEESSSQIPDAAGKAVVDLRALRDSMAPVPGDAVEAGGAAASAAQMGAEAQPATNGHDATAPAPPAGVPREAHVAAGIAAATSVADPRPAPESVRATAATPQPATKGMGWALGAGGLIVGVLVGAFFVGPMVGAPTQPPEDPVADGDTPSPGAGAMRTGDRRGTAEPSGDGAGTAAGDDAAGARTAAGEARDDDERAAEAAGGADDGTTGTDDGSASGRASTDSDRRSARRSGSRSRGSTGGSASAGAAAPGSGTEPEPEPAAADTDEPSSVNDAMLGAIARERQREEAAQEAASGPSAQPSRDNVRSVLGRMSGAIEACAAGQTGVASATLIVRGNGQVARASIGGSPFGGTPQGRCMEGVLRRARFEPFDAPTYRINYPFRVD